ncbi:hypothetical protein MRX96_019311 [Rhipicephalus microplus]|uniref:Myb/SANT-like DNA-binding domain-containing protein n=1 Tax=Rhipicephalus microplus TaxID=6941 RepID=A0A9J6D4G4_RHIMP|nr:uncharacterized protein LOC119178482 [Rhipicephalus microplus]KAH8008972.1 hypothetical protein HPB51_008543 [Rhipicephalus microplus]
MATSGSDALAPSRSSPTSAERLLFAMIEGTPPSSNAPDGDLTADGNATCSAPWDEGETRLLLTLYAQYNNEVGPFKKFRTKRAMYQEVAKEILKILGISRSAEQCDSRLKTIIRRKKNEVTNNRTSGRSRCRVSYEEFARIRALDDSIEPEVLRGVGTVSYKAAAVDSPSTSAQTTDSSGSADPSPLSSFPETEGDSSGSSSLLETEGTQAKRPKKDRATRAGTCRMQDMAFFFQEMRNINKEREQKKEEREKRREERHQELLKAHQEHIAALRDLAKNSEGN